MRTLTNGTDVLDSSGVDHDSWYFERFDDELPLSGRSSWWGAFRRGDQLHVELPPGHSTVDVRVLGRGFLALTGAIVGRNGGTLEFEVPRDGVYHLRFDGPAYTRFAFRLDVRIPRPARRTLRIVGATPALGHGGAAG